MPTSNYSHIPIVVDFLQTLRPTSILDVGVGNGKMGFIARDLLDVMLGQRHRRQDWRIKIDGIEIFSEYIQEHQRAIYNNIYIGDAFKVIDTLGNYELIILGDVLEHMEKNKAWQFLDKCATHSIDSIIINIPLGEKWVQGPAYGNPYEKHLSFWSYEEFQPFVAQKELFFFQNIGYYGCFLIKKDNYIHHRIRQNADSLFSEGRKHEAISFLKTSLSELPPDINSEYLLVDLLLKAQRINEAIERLKIVVKTFPEEVAAKCYLERLNAKLCLKR